MKSMDELNRLLSQQAPLDPLVKLLNDTFGPLGWEYEFGTLKVMAKVTEGHFLSVTRGAENLAAAAKLFGLEVKDAQSNEGQRTVDAPAASANETRPDSTGVAAQGTGVGQGGSEPSAAVPTGTPKPSRKVILDSISECSKVIVGQKRRTLEDLVKMLQMYGVQNKNQLTDDQAGKLLEQLNAITKE